MHDIIKRILVWMAYSSAFKKWNGIVGGFCLGLWVSGRYWREIRSTLEVWGVSRDQWMGFLLAVVGACGVAASIALSEAKKRMDKREWSGGQDRRGR